jgi:hypothetical protein
VFVPWTAPHCRCAARVRAVRPRARYLRARIGPASGMIEVADRGTLFLDEIGSCCRRSSPSSSALQERQIRRVGGTKFVNVDIRLVSATNRDTAEPVRKGRVPGRPVRSRQRDHDCAAAAPGAGGGRGASRTTSCDATGGTVSRSLRASSRHARVPRGPRLARQRPRAPERDRARLRGRTDR